MHPAPNDEPDQIPVTDSSQMKKPIIFVFRVLISENVRNRVSPRSTWVVLGWIGMNLESI